MTKRSLMQSLGPHQSEEGVKKRLRKDQSKMKYKLVISKPISATDGLEEDGKAVFYKDQGGKLRTMECTVQLRSVEENMRYLEMSMPLKLTLCYENEEVVAKQDYLSISEEVRSMRINKGTFHLKFRIEDVSKNHGRRRFRVMIAPKGANFEAICRPVFTEPVLIKSKKNKPKYRDIGDYLATSSFETGENRKNGVVCYKLNDALRRQFKAGKMNINLAAAALIEYSAKTTMFLNSIVEQQKQFHTDFRNYVEPSINYLVSDIKNRRQQAGSMPEMTFENQPTVDLQDDSKSNVDESSVSEYCFDAANPSLRLNETRPVFNMMRGSSMQLISDIQGISDGDKRNSLGQFLSSTT